MAGSDGQRRTVHYSGRVQGVGFRYTARRIAQTFAVTGFVQNLPDGRVLLVAEGTGEELDRFLNRLQEEMRDYIRKAEVHPAKARGEFGSFDISSG